MERTMFTGASGQQRIPTTTTTSSIGERRTLSSGGGRVASSNEATHSLLPVAEAGTTNTAIVAPCTGNGTAGFVSKPCTTFAATVNGRLHLMPSDSEVTRVSSIRKSTAGTTSNSSTKMVMVRSRHSSVSSEIRAQELLHNVGRAIQRTRTSLRRSRWIHVVYLVALPVYTLLGAAIFKTLDGAHDDAMVQLHKDRCNEHQRLALQQLNRTCAGLPFDACFEEVASVSEEVAKCFRKWHKEHRELTHPMSKFTNAVVYAFSVYTTIGYGNVAPDTIGCRLATIIYAVLGIPLFFAFVKEEGIFLMKLFIAAWARLKSCRSKCGQKWKKLRAHHSHSYADSNVATYSGHGGPISIVFDHACPQRMSSETSVIGNGELMRKTVAARQRRSRKSSSNSVNSAVFSKVREQHIVVAAAIGFWLLFMLAVSALFSFWSAEWSFFTSFYFLFNSVALIGFGDVFPEDPSMVLFNCLFIVIGVVLFSMCYFILQEEIRHRAVEVSTRARLSISNYGHSLFVNTRTNWSRRNSPSASGVSGGGSLGRKQKPTFDRLRKRRQSEPVAHGSTSPDGTLDATPEEELITGGSCNLDQRLPVLSPWSETDLAELSSIQRPAEV